MFNPSPDSSAVAPAFSSGSPTARGGSKRVVIGSFLSAVVPGIGQFMLGSRRRGITLVMIFGGFQLFFWPLRLPRTYEGLLLVVVVWFLLSGYAVCDVLLLSGPAGTRKPSKWWLLSVLPFAYIGMFLIFIPMLRLSSFGALRFRSTAMEPTLFPQDYFIYERNYYRRTAVNRNDLVVLRRDGYLTVKRVIALGGDTIEATDRRIMVNGKMLDEPFILHSKPMGTTPEVDTFGPVAIPKGAYFVMGDNRDISLDSRLPEFGLLNGQSITGRPLYIVRSSENKRVGNPLH